MRDLWAAARQLRWQDVVDVAILTFVLLRAYAWLRGTVALQVALGMLTLVAAALGARAVGLVLTAYVLQAIGAVVVLVAVVIFRDEIRRALGRASPLSWRRERPSGRAAEAASPAMRALADGLLALARKRIGALVVLPRGEAALEHVTGGTRLDAVVTPQLLEAIFHTASPIHDGAAVIEGGRLRLAGAFLPLSSAPDLPEALGTRHRAAVGMSEVSDAIVLAVSEERGVVSIAVGGRLAVQPAAAGPAALAARLDDLVRSPAVPPGRPLTAGESGIMAVRRRRRRRIREALARVAIFAGVVGVWYAVAGVRDSVITRTLPLELRGARDLPGFAPPRPNEVTLELRGPRRLITAASPADLHAWIDVAAARPGANELPVRAAAPPGIDVVRVFPPRVILEVLERRRLPVAVDARGGLAVKSVSPEAVDVVGRAEAFQGVDAVRTRPVGPGAVEGGEARTEVVLRPGLELVDEGQREVVVGVE